MVRLIKTSFVLCLTLGCKPYSPAKTTPSELAPQEIAAPPPGKHVRSGLALAVPPGEQAQEIPKVPYYPGVDGKPALHPNQEKYPGWMQVYDGKWQTFKPSPTDPQGLDAPRVVWDGSENFSRIGVAQYSNNLNQMRFVSGPEATFSHLNSPQALTAQRFGVNWGQLDNTKGQPIVKFYDGGFPFTPSVQLSDVAFRYNQSRSPQPFVPLVEGALPFNPYVDEFSTYYQIPSEYDE